MNDLIIPEVVERIYREIARPRPTPQPARVPADPKPIALTRADVVEILQRKRPASPEELQHILDHSKELGVSEWDRSQISVDMTIAMAQRARQGNGRRIDANAEFIAKVLCLVETPFGLLARSFVDDLLRDGSRNISRCRLHRPPDCACWSAQRAILFQASAGGDRSPEGWAAMRIRAALEQLELASSPEVDRGRSAT